MLSGRTADAVSVQDKAKQAKDSFKFIKGIFLCRQIMLIVLEEKPPVHPADRIGLWRYGSFTLQADPIPPTVRSAVSVRTPGTHGVHHRHDR